MNTYSPYFSPGLYYLTVETVGREALIVGSVANHLLRTVLNEVKQSHPFQSQAFAILPDHLHLLLKPEAGVALTEIVYTFGGRFARQYAELIGQPKVAAVWQRQHRAQAINNAADFAAHVDWIHYNPVHHQWVAQPEAWPYSSFETWRTRGIYPAEWGWQTPENLRGKRWG